MIASRADKFRMLSKFGPKSWALWAVISAMIDCCNAQLQIPKRDILFSFENKRDRSNCIHNKMIHVMFHETASRKLLVFTLYTRRMEFPILIFWTSS